MKMLTISLLSLYIFPAISVVLVNHIPRSKPFILIRARTKSRKMLASKGIPFGKGMQAQRLSFGMGAALWRLWMDSPDLLYSEYNEILSWSCCFFHCVFIFFELEWRLCHQSYRYSGWTFRVDKWEFVVWSAYEYAKMTCGFNPPEDIT